MIGGVTSAIYLSGDFLGVVLRREAHHELGRLRVEPWFNLAVPQGSGSFTSPGAAAVEAHPDLAMG